MESVSIFRWGALPFEELAVSRASDFKFTGGVTLRTCSAEDLVVLKLFASRPLDIRDAEGVIIRHKKVLDWHYIEEQLRPLVELRKSLRSFTRWLVCASFSRRKLTCHGDRGL